MTFPTKLPAPPHTGKNPVAIFIGLLLLIMSAGPLQAEIRGTVIRGNYRPVGYAQHYQIFEIMAYDPESGNTYNGELDQLGNFTIFGLNQQQQVKLSWVSNQPLRQFALWPLSYTPSPGAISYRNCFRFKKINDIYFIEKQNILNLINEGNFSGADERLKQLEKLYEFTRGEDGALSDKILTFKFKILQEMTVAASNFRSLGRSRVSDDMIAREREWYKKMTLVANPVATRKRFYRVIISLNAWANFSREAYRKRLAAWPSRSLDSGGLDMFYREKETYLEWMAEDVQFTLNRLAQPQCDTFMEQLGLPERLDLLSEGQRKAWKKRRDLLAKEADKVNLNKLMNLLSALDALRALAVQE